MTLTHDPERRRAPGASAPAPSSASLLQLVGLPYFLIAFIARLPFAMMVVGVLTVIVAARGSLALGGLTSAIVGVGTACVGPALGAAADRFGQRRVLLVLSIANPVMLILFTIAAYADVSDTVVLLAAFGIGATAPQVAPLSRARLSVLISERMPRARHARTMSSTMAYESAADEIVFVFGPVLVGLLAALLAPWAPLVAGAALAVVSVAAFALHPTGAVISASRRPGGTAPSRPAEVLRPRILVVAAGIFGVGLFFGTTLTALTSFMADRGVAEEAGLLYGVMGIGSAILALAVARFPVRFALAARWLVFGSVLLAGTLLLPGASSTASMVLALAVLGIGVGPTLVTQYSLGASRSPRGRSATVMTMLGSAVILGQALGSAVAGSVAESLGTRAALWLPAVAALVVVLAAAGNLAVRESAPEAVDG